MPRNLFLSALVTSSNYSTLRIGCKAKPVLIKLTCQRNQRKIQDRWLQWLHRLQPMFSLTSAFECAQKPFVGRLLGIMEFVLLWGKLHQIAQIDNTSLWKKNAKNKNPQCCPTWNLSFLFGVLSNGHFFWCPLFKGMLRCRWMVETLPPAITILQRFACRFNPSTIFNPLNGEVLKLWHLPMTTAMTIENHGNLMKTWTIHHQAYQIERLSDLWFFEAQLDLFVVCRHRCIYCI